MSSFRSTTRSAAVPELWTLGHKTRFDFMSMGGPGDHPIGDLIYYGQNPFPADIADLVRQLFAIDPKMRDTFALDAYDWEAGTALDEGHAKLRAELQKHKTRLV